MVRGGAAFCGYKPDCGDYPDFGAQSALDERLVLISTTGKQRQLSRMAVLRQLDESVATFGVSPVAERLGDRTAIHVHQ